MRGFGELEAVIMDRLWSWNRPTSVREMVEDLRRDRQIAYTTVMTVMDNLHRKGAVERELDGRAYRYLPAHTREQYVAGLLSSVLDDAGDARDRTAALLGFVGRMSNNEVRVLRRALDEYDTGRAAQ